MSDTETRVLRNGSQKYPHSRGCRITKYPFTDVRLTRAGGHKGDTPCTVEVRPIAERTTAARNKAKGSAKPSGHP